MSLAVNRWVHLDYNVPSYICMTINWATSASQTTKHHICNNALISQFAPFLLDSRESPRGPFALNGKLCYITTATYINNTALYELNNQQRERKSDAAYHRISTKLTHRHLHSHICAILIFAARISWYHLLLRAWIFLVRCCSRRRNVLDTIHMMPVKLYTIKSIDRNFQVIKVHPYKLLICIRQSWWIRWF